MATEAPERTEAFMTLLKRRRMAVGLTQTALAKRMKLTQSTVSFWESGTSLPSPRFIPKLAGILQIDPMELTRVLAPEVPRETAAK